MLEDNEYGLAELQQKLVEMMIELDAFFQEHQIEYYLMGGSALGAIRHQGFIPWDDDLDIFMTPVNYKKFLDVAKQKLDTNKFYLQEELSQEWPLPFSKIRLNNTTFIEEVNRGRKVHQGIFVDVFSLQRAAPSKIGRKIQYYLGKIVIAKSLTRVNYVTQSTKKKFVLGLMKLLPLALVNHYLVSWMKRYDDSSGTSKQGELDYALLFGKSKFKNAFYPASVLGAPNYVTFESTKLPVPEKFDQYLKLNFGDYMTLPPEADRVAAQHALVVDVNENYTSYLK